MDDNRTELLPFLPRHAETTDSAPAFEVPASEAGDTEARGGFVPARLIVRATKGLLGALGYRTLVEFPLTSGRRVDIAALDRRGNFAVVEVKSSLADYRADRKWQEYLPYCDRFYFAVAHGFPLARLPEGTGAIVTDGFEATVLRDAPEAVLSSARRKAMLLRFARTATGRLAALGGESTGEED